MTAGAAAAIGPMPADVPGGPADGAPQGVEQGVAAAPHCTASPRRERPPRESPGAQAEEPSSGRRTPLSGASPLLGALSMGSDSASAGEDDALAQWVRAHGGSRVIRRVLIANNGIGAVKEMRSVRRWALDAVGDARAVRFLAMASPEDVDAHAEYIRMADEHVLVPGGPNNMNYANVRLVVEVAQRAAVDAVWAGWGHASENPRLPDALAAVGIAFVGPPGSAMRALGDKVSSMLVADIAGVPTLPWSGSGLAASDARFRLLHASMCSGGSARGVSPGAAASNAASTSTDSSLPNSTASAPAGVETAKVSKAAGTKTNDSPMDSTDGTASVSKAAGTNTADAVMESADDTVPLSKAAGTKTNEVPRDSADDTASLSKAANTTPADAPGDSTDLGSRVSELSLESSIPASTVTEIPGDLYAAACVSTPAEALAAATGRVGFPLMVKASAGGGGKGIRRVDAPGALAAALDAVQREVPGSPVFLMRLAARARHLEVQVLADAHGQVVSLHGRDCSVQRRHQKILEEAPVTAVRCAAAWAEMERAAVRLARLVGYVSAGTVEFLYAQDGEPEAGRYSFLELNPRLQVEHPCSEMVAGVNLPAAQLLVAMGVPLHRIPDVRALYGLPDGDSRVDFGAPQRPPRGHVVAARITAENADAGFKPGGGRVRELLFRAAPDAWGYFGIAAGCAPGAVHDYADSQFGHVFAWGRTRDAARRALVAALRELSVRGDFPTTAAYLVRLLLSPAFAQNTHSTAWLDGLLADRAAADAALGPDASAPPAALQVVGAAAWLAHRDLAERRAAGIALCQKGQRPAPEHTRRTADVSFVRDGTQYRLRCAMAAPSVMSLEMNGSTVAASVTSRLEDGLVLAVAGGRTLVVQGVPEAGGFRLAVGAASFLVEGEHDPSVLRSPSSGKLVRFLVDDGALVAAGAPVAEVEVMKMYMAVAAAEAGRVRALRAPGCALRAGDAIARLELASPAVPRARPCVQTLPALGPPALAGLPPHRVADERLAALRAAVVDGFPRGTAPIDAAFVSELVASLTDPALPLSLAAELLSNLSGRIPRALEDLVSREICPPSSPGGSTKVRGFRSEPDVPSGLVTRPANGGSAEPQNGLPTGMTTFSANGGSERPTNGLSNDLINSSANGTRVGPPNTRSIGARTSPGNSPPGQPQAPPISNTSAEQGDACDAVTETGECVASPRHPAARPAQRTPAAHEDTLGRLAHAVKMVDAHVLVCDKRDAGLVASFVAGLRPHLGGPDAYAEAALAAVLDAFADCAALFDGAPTTDAVFARIKDALGDDADAAFAQFAAHAAAEARVRALVVLVREAAPRLCAGPMLAALKRVARLADAVFAPAAQAAREALSAAQLPSLAQLRVDMEARLSAVVAAPDAVEISRLARGAAYYMDVLPAFFLHESRALRVLAMEIYVRRVYEALDFIGAACLVDASAAGALRWVVAAPRDAQTVERRAGVFAAYASAADAQRAFPALVATLAPAAACRNLVYVALPDAHEGAQDADARVVAEWEPFLAGAAPLLARHEIRRVTIVTVRAASAASGFYTFRGSSAWREDGQVRNLEPALSYLLELPRISQHHAPVALRFADPSGQIHIYSGACGPHTRLFVRVLVRPMASLKRRTTLAALADDARAVFADILDALAMVEHRDALAGDAPACNHLYVHLLPTIAADPHAACDVFRSIMAACEERLLRLRVSEGEIRMSLSPGRGAPPERHRFFLWNETGFVNRVVPFVEKRDPETGALVLHALDDAQSGDPRNGAPATQPHAPLSALQVRRNRVHALETSYVHDFPAIFARAAELAWDAAGLPAPADVFSATEMVLKKDALAPPLAAPRTPGAPSSAVDDGSLGPEALEDTRRPPGENTIGMVAWRFAVRLPEGGPEPLVFVAIANDISFQLGSFGVAEDRLFAAASRYARANGYPRIFLAANSGARIGLADELRAAIRVRWVEPDDPARGPDYLFLEPDDYARLSALVSAELVPERGHYRITDVLGGLGVENLSGSALVASETAAAAAADAPTLTLVTGRTVGIGAYLVRLGQRVIQRASQPIILTGVAALNQLLGRDVYASNLQIGGPHIMAANGVSHLVVRTDLEGAQAALRWLAFLLPAHPPAAPVRPPAPRAPPGVADDPERPVAYVPPAPPQDAATDPRLLLTGAAVDGAAAPGLLDRGSWVEYHAAWARSVVVGRGRLGGIPVATVVVETRTTHAAVPADPASPSSEALRVPQAGQVWFPDSAFKTAQFVRDVSRGEALPLLILANWRGFSGGQRDLYDAVLKFGADIVDALRVFRQPVIVYLPPHGQLRGGSWVVVDTAINARRIEMYASPSARGGIIEPEGLVAVKFRRPALLELANRILGPAAGAPDEARVALARQVACAFADLHDRPGRMRALGVVRAVVEWRDARRVFFHRLRVLLWLTRLAERAAHLLRVSPEASDERDAIYDALAATVHSDWLPALGVESGIDDDAPDGAAMVRRDAAIADALDRHAAGVETRLQAWVRMRTAERIEAQVAALPAEERAVLLARLAASAAPVKL